MPKRKLGDQAEKSSGSSPCRSYCVVIHSGKHKPFAELLCRDLEARGCPAYFDTDSDSLVKSEASVHATVEVAAAARLAILLLSDEFFAATKWPMLEFSAFAQKHFEQITHLSHVKFILPVYLRMSVKNLVCTNTYLCDRHYRPIWYLTPWENWARADPRVHLQKWEDAWSTIMWHEAVHVCIPHGSCDWTRHSQRILGDDQGRRMIVERVLTDPTLGFAGTSIQRFAHATTNFARQHVHATQPHPQQVRVMPSASLQAQEMTGSSQQVHTVPAGQAQHHDPGQSVRRSARSHAPDVTALPPAPLAIPQPGGRMQSLFNAAELQLKLSASIPPRREHSVPAFPPTPRSAIPEWRTQPPFNLKGESSTTAECGCNLSDDDHGRDSCDSRDEEHCSDDEHEEENGSESDEKDSGVNEELEDVEEDDDDEEDVDGEDEDEDDDDDDGDDDVYEEDSGSDGDHSG